MRRMGQPYWVHKMKLSMVQGAGETSLLVSQNNQLLQVTQVIQRTDDPDIRQRLQQQLVARLRDSNRACELA